MKHFLLLAFFIFFLCGSVIAQEDLAANANSGFEIRGNDGMPDGWQSFREGAGEISADTISVHSGTSSLLINNGDYKKSTVQSNEVKLTAGNLYRLSAWVKTGNACTKAIEQYPTPVAACLSMASFPFTSHSTAGGGSSGWQKIEVLFIATQAKDRICLNLGYNGEASGKAWFDDVSLEEVNDITEYIPAETIRWFGKAFRFEDKGWNFVHIEGEPYERGRQYGYLAAEEIKEFINKLAIKKNDVNPLKGWNDVRFSADAMMLRKYDPEYLEEMKGIAAGANKAGMSLFNRPYDLLDIVALNSFIDIDYCADALHVTSNPLTGRSFLAAEDELTLQDKLHKCSGFLATKSATSDNRIVFGQLFMWNGYTGPHWNFIIDVIPSKGNRLVYETFPGGINSGADFYINSSGIMIGETTVDQGPYNAAGTPQSNRIRKAAQYANNIDDVVDILTKDNNGLYTNDWLIGDTKTDEVAILVLGTQKHRLWRSSQNDFYGGQKDWYFSDNNNRSLEVRKEYITNDDNAPYDIVVRPVYRDISFTKFYKDNYGKIDACKGMNFWNSSPVNRPHACDGKMTTSEMAEKMMFFANYGKVTLRETFIGENGRVPDMPGAMPHFSLGYSVISPVFFTDKIKELKGKSPKTTEDEKETAKLQGDVKAVYTFDKNLLWHNTVYPASEKENWYISGTAAYWNMLNSMPSASAKAMIYMKDELSELNCRMLYTIQNEGSVAPVDAVTSFDHFKYYQIPRIRGTFLLHQLRLYLGNDVFSKALNSFHEIYREKEITSDDLIKTMEKESGRQLKPFVSQWIERDDMPELKIKAVTEENSGKWKLNVSISQAGKPYHCFIMVKFETSDEQTWQKIELTGNENNFSFDLNSKPVKLTCNAGNDIPLGRSSYFTFSNFTDNFSQTIIVYGTSSQDEANHTLGLRFQKMAADRFTEVLLPVKKDVEISDKELAGNDIVILGGLNDNMLAKQIANKVNLQAGKNHFTWMGKTYGNSDEGLFAAFPNPYNPVRTVYFFCANSSMELYNMTKTLYRMPSWAVFKKDQIADKGYFMPADMEIEF